MGGSGDVVLLFPECKCEDEWRHVEGFGCMVYRLRRIQLCAIRKNLDAGIVLDAWADVLVIWIFESDVFFCFRRGKIFEKGRGRQSRLIGERLCTLAKLRFRKRLLNDFHSCQGVGVHCFVLGCWWRQVGKLVQFLTDWCI